MNNRQILQGDVLKKLREIPNDTIDCIISSPPYWGLRDYGIEGQLGLEPDFRDYLKKLDEVMVQLKRVLKGIGTCWINLGDTYSGSGKGFGGDPTESKETCHLDKKPVPIKNIMEKSRFGIPERFYISCIDSGWIARNHVPWYKSNSMPSSVKDRFTNKWESVFFFAKEQKYYFNLDAVREKTVTNSKPFNLRVRNQKSGKLQKQLGILMKSHISSEQEMARYNKDGTIKEKYKDNPQSNVARLHKNRKGNPNKGYTNEKLGHRNGLGKSTLGNKQDSTLGADGKPKPTYKGFNDRWKFKQHENTPDSQSRLSQRTAYARNVLDMPHDNPFGNMKGKNPGDVFFINPRPFAEAHFATFPVELPLKILKCACPPNGIVLDPFFGAGTVGVAAEHLGLRWMGIDLKEEYIKIARSRLEPYLNNKMDEFL